MRTRSAEKKSAGKQQSPAAQTPPAASTKRTPPSRSKRTPPSSAADEAKASDVDGAVQSTPEAKPPSGRKTTRRVTRKVVKKAPASSRTTPNKAPTPEDAGMAMLEDPGEEKDVEDSKEDPVEEDAADSKESNDIGTEMLEDRIEEKDTREDLVEEKDAAKWKESKDAETTMLENPAQEKDEKENLSTEKDAAEEPVKEAETVDSKEDHVKEAEASKECVKEEDTKDPREENAAEEKDTEGSKEDISKVEDAEDLKEDAAKESMEASKDVAKGEDAEDPKEDAVKEKNVEDSKEDIMKMEDVQDPKEDSMMEEDAGDLKEDIVKMKDTEGAKEYAADLKEDPEEDAVEEKDAEGSIGNSVKEEDAVSSKEDQENDAEDLNNAGLVSMYETDPEEIGESSNNLGATAQNVVHLVTEDENGNKEEQAGDAQEEPANITLMSIDEVTIVNDVRSSVETSLDVSTSENQGPITTDVKSEDPIIEDMKSLDNQELDTTELKSQEGEGSTKVKEESELQEERDESTLDMDSVDAKCAEDRMEEDKHKNVKGKDISLDEADEDKIEAFADVEEFAEDDVSEHCEEAEALEDERAQLNALAKERKKRKELEVFVGGLDRDAVEEDVKKVFQHVGEVIDVRMDYEMSTKKNKGYAFVKFATKEHVARVLAEMRNPVIRGKRCGTAPSEDNDTLFLGNICNTWTKEAVKQKLKDVGVEGVENITLVADPKHEGLSRGFAFLEFLCHAEAMTAYKRLQRPDIVFGHSERTAKVAFAEPLRDPDPEVMAQVKSVFVDGLPPYWDEDRVREKFKDFGEIARITLARNMLKAKRKDFGFVDFSTHEAAVACVEGINNTELGDENLKAKVRARLSNPLPKSHAVKGGMCGGFRINRGAIGRGFPRGGHTFGRANFPRGRGFYPRGPGYGGRTGFAEHDFGSSYPPFHGRSNFGRGGRWNFSGAHPAPPGGGPMFLDRMRHGGRGHADDAFLGRHQFPIGHNRPPFMGRRFEDRYYYDNSTEHGLKRPFSMTEPDPDYMGPSRRPRFGYSDSASSLHGDRYRDTFPPGGNQDRRDYYGPDYGRGGQYPPFYGGDNRPYGRGYGRGYY